MIYPDRISASILAPRLQRAILCLPLRWMRASEGLRSRDFDGQMGRSLSRAGKNPLGLRAELHVVSDTNNP